MSDQEKKTELQMESVKGHKLFCKYWNDDQKENTSSPKALVMIVHGFAEHCQLYDHIANLLVSQGYFVFSHDHVGHGKSEGKRAQIDDFDVYVKDVFHHLDTVKQRFPNIPVFLVGHSMGGTITLRAALEKPEYFRGIVLIAPLINTDHKSVTPMRVLIGKMMSRVLPDIHLGTLDEKQISRDPDFVKLYSEDPLIYHTGMRCRLAMVLYEVLKTLKTRLPEVNLPFLTLHGSKDTLCDIQGSKLLHEQAKSTDKEMKVFEDAYHQLHNELEPVKSDTCNMIADWLNARS